MRRFNTALLSTKSHGFTIVELLIATTVFSSTLMLIAFGVMSLNKAYYQGIAQSNTQTVANTILTMVTQDIQINGGLEATLDNSSTGLTQGYCIGSHRYSYLPGWQLVTGTPDVSKNQTNYGLITDYPGGSCVSSIPQNLQSSSLSLTSDSIENLSPKMRLAKLTVQQLNPPESLLYYIDVRVVYGDNDLLRSPSGNSLGPAAPDAACIGGAGAQFCAASEVSAVVRKRLP